jgi:predicted dehydrogenase
MALRSSARYNSAGIGGVLMDMGPYYLTALVAMFGPARRVAGFARRSVTESTITNMASESYGETSTIEAPTAVAGTIEFDGVFAHLTTTVDSFKYGPALSVIGSEGVLTCNDPNMFGGPVIVERKGSEPRQMPLTHQYSDRNRGAGMVEMMAAVQAGRPHRASGRLAYHVMDIALSMIESGNDGRIRELAPGTSRPEPLRPGHTENPFL